MGSQLTEVTWLLNACACVCWTHAILDASHGNHTVRVVLFLLLAYSWLYSIHVCLIKTEDHLLLSLHSNFSFAVFLFVALLCRQICLMLHQANCLNIVTHVSKDGSSKE